MKTDTLYLDLLDACAETGCPVCRLSLKSMRRYMDSIMYECVNDPGVRAELRAARGYCNVHAWWLAEGHGHALGVAILQRDVVNVVLGLLEAAPAGRHARQRAQDLLKRLRPTAECPACAHRGAMEDLALKTLLEHVGDEPLTEALTRCGGVCLPHFARAVELAQANDALAHLVDLQRRTLSALRAELDELIRKHDYRYIDEGFGQEGDSWRRAIAMLCAERDAWSAHWTPGGAGRQRP